MKNLILSTFVIIGMILFPISKVQSDCVQGTPACGKKTSAIDCNWVTYYIYDEADNLIGERTVLECNWKLINAGGTNYFILMPVPPPFNNPSYKMIIPFDTRLNVKKEILPQGKSLILKAGSYLYNPAMDAYIGRAEIQ